MTDANQHSTPERNRVAREGAEWIDKMATVQSLASQREPFENMAAAVRSLANDYESLVEQLEASQREVARWLTWSDGQYPDESPGDVIHAQEDGTIVLDDGITTWNPLRALRWINDRRCENAERAARAGSYPASEQNS